MNVPGSSKPVVVTLDRERTLIYDQRAEYRMGTLERPFEVRDLHVRKKSWAALVAWTWACLSERDALDFPSPEKLAPLIKTEKAVDDVFEKFVDTWKAAQDDEKKENG